MSYNNQLKVTIPAYVKFENSTHHMHHTAVIHIKYKYMCRRRDRVIEKLNIVEMKKKDRFMAELC